MEIKQLNSPTNTSSISVVVSRRNGSATEYNEDKIYRAVMKAAQSVDMNEEFHTHAVQIVHYVTQQIASMGSRYVHVEDIQDKVELGLMQGMHHQVLRAFIQYRTLRAQRREAVAVVTNSQVYAPVVLKGGNGEDVEWKGDDIPLRVDFAMTGLKLSRTRDSLIALLRQGINDGTPVKELVTSVLLNAKSLLALDADGSKFIARVYLTYIYEEALGWDIVKHGVGKLRQFHTKQFVTNLRQMCEIGLLKDSMLQFDMKALSKALNPSYDMDLEFIGVSTLYDRYLLVDKVSDATARRLETPQTFWMRVAMGIHLAGDPARSDNTESVLELHKAYSTRRFCSSTPTLFNAGSERSQLSSCYLYKVDDSIESIMQRGIADNAYLSKWAGGLGGSWTAVRGTGARIKGTNGESQGVIPFLKLHNDQLVAVNQCFAPGTLVHTQAGPVPIENVVEGDLVLTEQGTYREVRETLEYSQNGKPMMKLRLKHSSTVTRVTSGHPFYAIPGACYEQTIKRTLRQLRRGQLAAGWHEAGNLKVHDYVGLQIPVEVVDHAMTEDEAFLYGAMLGNGHIIENRNEAGITCNLETGGEVLEAFRQHLITKGIHYWESELHGSCLQIGWTHDPEVWGWGRKELYDDAKVKRIHRHFTHLPVNKTVRLIEGLLKTDGNKSRGKEVTFSTSSRALGEGLRYQVLRLGAPTHAYLRNRAMSHVGTRADGTTLIVEGEVFEMKVAVPMIKELAELMDCPALTKFNWFIWQNKVFTRIKSIEPCTPVEKVYDLKVDGPASYCTVDALVHNGGKRNGSGCAYLETWHVDIVEFLELRKNVGDERRRAHDMNTANWIPDLFMKRWMERGVWTLFRSNDVPDLHELYGSAFEERYVHYEALAQQGVIFGKQMLALDLWKKMLDALYETKHPWITFKDPCNVRSPQQHVGVVHSSNLCTEITLNTSAEETAVCNLGSVVLDQHVDCHGNIDMEGLRQTVRTAVAALDNVIDVNFYPTEAARTSNLRHRPIGLGMMGMHYALIKSGIAFDSEEGIRFHNRITEALCYFAYEASSDLAVKRGVYQTYEGSLWSKGILPPQTVAMLSKERGVPVNVEFSTEGEMNWNALREKILKQGMRNSNVIAIAPTATISNIMGTTPCIEPLFSNAFTKSNLGGEFFMLNPYLVRDLENEGLWDDNMRATLKLHKGSLSDNKDIPDYLKERYKTAYQIDPLTVVRSASARQIWIDQSQSVNLWMRPTDVSDISFVYREAWLRGLKTTYYLRTPAASDIEQAGVAVAAASRSFVGNNAVQPDVEHYRELLARAKAAAESGADCEMCQ